MMMGLTYGKAELMEDLQRVFSKHNVESITVQKTGTLFQVEDDGTLSIGVEATIKGFDLQPRVQLRGIKGGRE